MPATRTISLKHHITTKTTFTLLATLFLLTSLLISTNFALAKSSTTCTTEEDCAQKLAEKNREYQSTAKKLNDILSNVNSVSDKINKLASQLNVTQQQITDLQNDITDLTKQLDEINKNLTDRKETLQDKIDLRNLVIRNYAKSSTQSDLELLIDTNEATGLNAFSAGAYSYIFNKKVSAETIKLIGVLNSEINSFEHDKKEAEDVKIKLEQSQKNLLAAKAQIEAQKNSTQSDLNNLKEDQKDTEEDLADIEDAISKLNSAQQKLLDEKNGTGTSSVGDYAQPEASLPTPKFSPAFVAMSYGAYTHYNGMSQYGAKGRAEAGQSYKDILKFYYKVDVKKLDSFPSKISVKGYGDMDFQKYLYGIAEMPSDWPDNALKAQAIAARTYAYKASKPICTSESCQVFLKSKSDNPPSKWKKAVDDTKGMILDNPKTSQYSSTTGGYINNIGWDKKGDWPGDAYEKRAKSPWFYKAWYTQGYSTSSDKCGLSSPWLSSDDMADILNAVTVWKKGNGTDRNRIAPVKAKCLGGNPYSVGDMADRADELGTKYDSVSNADVSIGSNGQTSSVTFTTNRGSVSIDGQTFKTVFNLRAPGYISIKSRLFDLIKK